MNKERTDSVVSNPLLLTGTGWDLMSQMRMIEETSKESNSLQEWKDKTIEKTRSDLEGLYFEYLIKSDVLPFELSRKDDRIVCAKYGDKPLPEVVSETERDGSIKKSIEKIEELLLNGEDGDTHVLISPPGWSGYESPHPTAQIYYYQKKGSEIKSMTFVSRKATLTDSEEIFHKLAELKPNREKDEKERILTLTSNVSSHKYLEPHDIVYCLEEVLQTPLPHMYEAINNLPEINSDVQKCINDLEVFIKNEIHDNSKESRTKLMYKIGQTVLDMKSVLTRGRKPETKEEYLESFIEFSKDDGCNGGGTIYGRNKENLTEEEEFPNWGLCRLEEFCISENRGNKQALGLCMICKSCDRAFKSGKTLEEIKGMNLKDSRINNEDVEYNETSFFVSAAFFFLSSLFKS